ncbi:MAG: hypothetical protein ABL998_11405 [Planctomycetota bacterium]
MTLLEGLARRASIARASLELAWRLSRLRAEERAALELCGEEFEDAQAAPSAGDLGGHSRQVASIRRRERELAGRLARDQADDDEDARSGWLAGVLARFDRFSDALVLREAQLQTRRALALAHAELGRSVLEDENAVRLLSASARARVTKARADLRAAELEHAALPTFGGALLWPALRVPMREIGTFLVFLRVELVRKFLPRLPALAAMGVAWWITRQCATPRLEREVKRIFGIDAGFSETTVERLALWLPILAAALVAYLLHIWKRRSRRRCFGTDLPGT